MRLQTRRRGCWALGFALGMAAGSADAAVVKQAHCSSGGGSLGSGNPMRAHTVIGVAIGGVAGSSTQTVRCGFPANGDARPPAVSAVAASGITTTSATITWTTDEPSTSQVEYGSTNAGEAATPVHAALATTHSVTLTALPSGHACRYRAASQDAYGNRATSSEQTFATPAPPPADTTPPSGSVTINQGSSATNQAGVTLTLSATDDSGSVAWMKYSPDGATYGASQAYAATASWTLSGGDGANTVYVLFGDAAGNWSSPAQDAITLDQTPPALAITAPIEGAVYGGSP